MAVQSEPFGHDAKLASDSPLARMWRQWRRNPIGLAGVVVVLLVIAAALFAPWIAPYNPIDASFLERTQPPSVEHWMGTDNLGRDILSRVIYGARVSLQVGLVAVGIGVVAGSLFGLVAGYYGGRLDNVIMRFMDVLFAFPEILLALAIVAALGPGLGNTMIAIGIVNVPIFTRLMRSSVLGLRETEFVEAEKALGAGELRILFRAILPNALAPVIVQGTLAFSSAILSEATLSFLGLGIQPPNPAWGSMLNEARRYMELAPWMAIGPAAAIMLAVIGFNLFGDGLRDVLDPRLKGE